MSATWKMASAFSGLLLSFITVVVLTCTGPLSNSRNVHLNTFKKEVILPLLGGCGHRP